MFCADWTLHRPPRDAQEFRPVLYNINYLLLHLYPSIMAEDREVTLFREYLRAKTVHPKPDYATAVAFLKRMAEEIDLPCQIIEMVAGKPIVIMTWEGTEPSLPTLLLNSHTDVVPVFDEYWKYDAFEATKDEEGNIYARGSQDMKCVGIQYLEAIRRMKAERKTFLRTIHLSFVPDEEISGIDGMEKFVDHEIFKKMNVGFALDEGLANPTEAFTVYYTERYLFTVEVTCPGNPGHGSRFIPNTAGEKLRKVMNSFLAFRDQEEARLNSNPDFRLGDVTTVNMTMVEGGVQSNVVPDKLSAVFDIRVADDVPKAVMKEKLDSWCADAGSDVTYKHLGTVLDQKATSTDKRDPWFNAFSTSMENMGLKMELEVFPAATDSRFLRSKGYPALGFSPMNHTPILLHDHNEFLNEKIFMKGITIYEKVIASLASVGQ